jgi:1,4-dihydroxy-2-naphthoate octaprenyltransferase
VATKVPEASDRQKSLNAWLLAVRPRTLPAAVAPVLVGSALAYRDTAFSWLPAAAALLVALLLQIGVNLANDYFDCVKGVDTNQRLGPLRVTQSGLLAPATVRAGTLLALGLSLVPGIYLVIVGGWPVAAAGIAALIAALAYSGGPFPLASNGLGDVFVFIFFGLVAVCGTYRVQAGTITFASVAMACIVGVLITAILVVNNLRDIESDRRAGKRTLAVVLDVTGTRAEYTVLLVAAYVGLPVVWFTGILSFWVLMPALSLPVGIALIKRIWQDTTGPKLNGLLAATASLALIFSLLLAVGLVFSVHLPG